MLSCECGKTFAKPVYPVYCRCGRTHYEDATIEQGEPPPPPAWVSVIRRLRKPSDRGVGDTVARLLGRFGERFKAWSQKLGIPCGCTARQSEWNERWPY